MTDYGRELSFGYFLVPNATDSLLDTAREVERLELDYVAVQDHPYQRRYVDTWVLLSMIAATTSRVRMLPDVANLPLRPPAVLAKAAASLDVLSGGRFELGLGAGGSGTPSRRSVVPGVRPARRWPRLVRRSRSSGSSGAVSATCATPGSTIGWPGRSPARCRRTP
jgi:alkanesulfonate monooxygenase SsuD/methylene tetrahydromethanopterin reductase-like flavin-dependent oxidoreductase (luciferase family)